MVRVLTFGTFDLFHVGHLNLLRRAAALGDELVVGVSTDSFSLLKKGKLPIFPESDRKKIVEAVKWVTQTFFEESFDKKQEYIDRYQADIVVMGDDWQGKFDYLQRVKVIYLPRTIGISTSEIIQNCNLKKFSEI